MLRWSPLVKSILLGQDQSEEGVCPRVVYALKRLVRGLASNRKGARHGFYVAFTEVKNHITVYS